MLLLPCNFCKAVTLFLRINRSLPALHILHKTLFSCSGDIDLPIVKTSGVPWQGWRAVQPGGNKRGRFQGLEKQDKNMCNFLVLVELFGKYDHTNIYLSCG